jgi:CMP-N-acetylneuraminic acid synthetase
MKKDMGIMALIPARGGSKRFPGKNLHPLMGRPLVAHPVEAAARSRLVGRVIISTDDDTIASAARQAGADVPFMRPAELAQDSSSVIDAAIYTVQELERRENYVPEYIVLLQPTTPVIADGQIDRAVEMARRHDADSVVAVSEVDTINHPYNIRTIADDGTIAFWQERPHYQYYAAAPRPKFYHAANMWLTRRETLVGARRLEGARNFPMIVDPVYASDIDYEADLLRIEAYLEYLRARGRVLP